FPSAHSLTLNTGAKMPLLGLGTFMASFLATDPDQLRATLRTALDAGYRLIDTAYLYQNEDIIGEVLEEYFSTGKLKREDVFVTTKLPLFAMEPEAVAAFIKKQLTALRLSYIDLYLIHTPCAVRARGPCKSIPEMSKVGYDNADDIELIDVWRVLERGYKDGLLKAIGVSNFNVRQLQDLYDKAEIKPANLQIELHIYWPQNALVQLCEQLNIVITAYSPIGAPGKPNFGPAQSTVRAPLHDEVVAELAKKYGKTPAQILLRHIVQRGIVAIPKSTNEKRVRENIDIFDFELNAADETRLLAIDYRTRMFSFPFVRNHRHYPFDELKSAE
ncbi:hypothetical protein PRIPAC_94091, partial [Pristionchus pacificus]